MESISHLDSTLAFDKAPFSVPRHQLLDKRAFLRSNLAAQPGWLATPPTMKKQNGRSIISKKSTKKDGI